MSNNRTFFKKARQGEMSYKDIFSQVFQKHTAEETAQVFIAGTALTTPSEAEMLAGWQKPFLFARFFLADAIVAAAGYFMYYQWKNPYGSFLTLTAMALLVPVALLLLTWEMNVPRNISLYEVLGICAIGGALSLVATLFMAEFDPTKGAQWAPLTEEPAKLLIIYLYLRKKDQKYILNGMLVGMAVGVGFAAMETLGYNIYYTMRGAINSAIKAAGGISNIDEEMKAMIEAMAMNKGIKAGLEVARNRAQTALGGHGTWAALYGGALVMVKGREKLSFNHLLKPQFLKYFAAAFALHYVHNSDVELSLLVKYGALSSTAIFLSLLVKYGALSAIAMFLFLRLLKMGVNEIVAITADLNGGRVTRAVERDVKPGVNVLASGAFHLEFLTGPYAGKRVSLPSGRSLTLGRVQGKCDVALPQCGDVSSRHCSITCTGNAVTVMDLGSTNGTTVDGQRAPAQTAVPARAGSVIILGKGECRIRVVC